MVSYRDRPFCLLFGILMLIGMVVWTAPARAQDQERSMTFSEAVDLFARNNLSLQLSKFRIQEQEALVLQATAYPNPSLSLTHEPLYGEGTTLSETYFNVIQPIEWAGLRNARIDAAKRLTESANSQFQADSLQLLFEVTKAYIQTSTAATRKQHLEQITEIFREASRSAIEQHASGELSGYEMRRLKIEQARYENRLALSELDLHRFQRKLGVLLLPQEQGVRIIPSSALYLPQESPNLDEALEHAAIHRAELSRALADVEAARFTITRNEKEITPAPVFTAGYKRQSNGFNGLFLGTLVNLPVFDRNQGAINAATYRLHQAETRLLLAQQQIEQDVRQSHETFVSLQKRVDYISNDLLADSEALLQAAQTSYSEGEINLVELLDASDAYYDAQMTSTTLFTNLLVAYYDYMRATGQIPIN